MKTASGWWTSSEELSKALAFDAMGHLCMLVDGEGRCRTPNRASLRWSGATVSSDEPIWDLPWLAYDARAKARIKRWFARAMAGERVRHSARLRRADGEDLWCELEMRRLDTGGAATDAIVLCEAQLLPAPRVGMELASALSVICIFWGVVISMIAEDIFSMSPEIYRSFLALGSHHAMAAIPLVIGALGCIVQMTRHHKLSLGSDDPAEVSPWLRPILSNRVTVMRALCTSATIFWAGLFVGFGQWTWAATSTGSYGALALMAALATIDMK